MGLYDELCVALAITSVTLAIEPLVGLAPFTPGTQGQRDIQFTTAYLSRVSSGTHLSTNSNGTGEQEVGKLVADSLGRESRLAECSMVLQPVQLQPVTPEPVSTQPVAVSTSDRFTQ